MTAALRLLSRRARSRRELSSRLQEKGYAPAILSGVIKKLDALGYLDDRQFAGQWVRDRGRIRGWGPHRMRGGLREKGVRQDWIEEAIGAFFSEKGEDEAAVELLVRRFSGLSGEASAGPREKRRMFSYLYRRGYSQDVIYEALRRFLSSSP